MNSKNTDMKKQKYKTTKELEYVGLTKCDFSDECDCCKDPQGGSFAVGYVNDMCGEECDSYICRKCATESYDEMKAYIES